jgi:ABC-2 type transport system permease protein
VAEILIRLKLTSLRHAFRGGQATYLWLGALVGLGLAARSLAIGLEARSDPAALDTLAILTALWLVGWILIAMSGGDPLRPEYFGLIPIDRRRLAWGLLVASAVGVLPAATLLAFAGLIVAASASGAVVAVVALVATGLLVSLVIVTSKVIVAATGQAMNSRAGIELAGFQRGLLIAMIWIWIPIAAVAGVRPEQALDLAPIAAVARALPTGWGVIAVEAARDSAWVLAVAAIASLAGLVVLLVAAWAKLLDRRLTQADAGRGGGAAGAGSIPALAARLVPATPFGALVLREAVAWIRDPRRSVEIRTAIWTAVILTILPGLVGNTVLWPFAGITIVVTAAITTANLYGMDGTAIWMTAMSPRALRLDVRARQLVWIAIFGAIGLVGTVVPTALSGQAWAWPWVLAALPALVGGAAGLVPLLGILVPAPLPERRGGDPLDLGDDPRTTNAYMVHGVLMTFVVPIAALPAVATTALAAGAGEWVWIGVPVGVATGLLAAWTLGRLAGWRLETRAPELIERMRSRPGTRDKGRTAGTPEVPTSAWVAILVGSILLFPQSIAPLLIRLSGSDSRLWFAPLYLPDPFQLVAIIAMGSLGVLAYLAAWRRIAASRRQGVGEGRQSGRRGGTGGG